MKIDKKLNIIQIFASADWGGGERYVSDLSQALAEDGHTVVLISKKRKGSRESVGTDHYYKLPMNGVFDLFSAFKLSALIKKEDIDIIHVHNFKSAFAAAYAKIISRRNVRIILTRHLVKAAKTDLRHRWLYKKLDSLIFVSNLAKEEFLSSQPKIDHSKITVIHNSVKESADNPTNLDVRANYNIGQSTSLLACMGRIVSQKGIKTLLEAINKIKDRDFKLFIIGTGDKSHIDELKDYISQNNLSDKVIFTGFTVSIQTLVSQIDIGIIPSIIRESFGLSVIEFMRLGKPIITSDNGTQREFINNGVNGYMIPPSNSDELATLLLLLIDDKQLRERIGKNAKEYFYNNLGYDQFYQQILSIYRHESKADAVGQFEVLFDAEKIKYPNTGLYTFDKHLSRALYDQAIERGHTFGVYCPKQASNHLLSVPYKSSRYLLRYYFSLNRQTKVWHAPFQTGKFFPVSGQKIVLTIHDLNFLYDMKGRSREKWLRKLQRNIDKADHLVAISNFTKTDVQRHLNVGDKPFDVIYNGYTPHRISEQETTPLTQSKFLFSMATILPKKNFHVLPALLVGNDYQLIIAGNLSSYVNDIIAEAEKYGVQSRLKIVGPISEQDKLWYLKNCEAFLFPSIAEGFGLPVIEAMYYQKPIFISKHTCLPEIGGDICYYFNYEFDRQLMQKEFKQGMEDFAKSDKKEALRKRAQSFTWDRAAEQYWNIYETLLKSE